MTKLIMKQRPVGRFGNHLFQKNILDQLAYKYSLSVHHPKFIGSEFSPDFRSTRYLTGLMVRPTTKLLELKDLSVGWSEIELRIAELIDQDRMIEIPSGVMGARFFESLYKSPHNIGGLSDLFSDSQEHLPYIAMHFRGTDFRSWNELADIDSNYYLKACSYLQNSEVFTTSTQIRLVTDEPTHETVKKIVRETGAKILPSRGFLDDFKFLLNSKGLISSPSTFAIWAAIIGEQKLVTFPEQWVNSRIKARDAFWEGISINRGNLFESVTTL